MRKKSACLWWLFIVFLLVTLVPCSPVFAAKKWYDYYREAQRVLKEKNYREAIELLTKAIELEPEPSKKKRAGFSSLSYFPYLRLGLAYLAIGDYEAAQNSCEQAQERGAAPRQTVEKCLAITSKYVKPSTKTISQPTPESAITSVSRQEHSPQIQLISSIPSETTLESLDIQGIAKDEDGVKEVKITTVNKDGFTRTMTITLPQRQQEVFRTSRLLDEGNNTITIEAIDTQGHSSTQEFIVVRKISVALAPTQIPTVQTQMDVPTPKPTPKSTPIPTPIPTSIPTPIPTPQPDARPIVKVLSTIPTETTEKTIEIWGMASDDYGIQDVTVNVQQAGKKGLIIAATSKRVQDNFTATVNLAIGENTIMVEAIDTAGQTAKQVLTVIRRSLPPPKPDTTPFVAEIEEETASLQRPGDVYAVIIGIGDYKDVRIPDLNYTVNDARGLYEILTDSNYGGIPKDHIELLLDEKATYPNIKSAIGKWLPQQAKQEDTVIIYYSGHGAPEGRATYWVTHNANIDDLYATAMNNDEIARMLDGIHSDRVITFLDSCYSAATVNRTLKTRSIETEIPWEKFSGKGRVAISASDGKQLSLELDEYKHGVFTYYLLEALRGQADENSDGVIEVDEVWDYVKYQVIETARKAGNPQTPVLQGSITAGIPITFNVPLLRQKKEEYQIAHKLRQLQDLVEEGKILPQHYNCAYKILKSGDYNVWIESLLSGTIDPEVFNNSFQCR